MHLSHPHPHSHSGSILTSINNDSPQTKPKTKTCKDLKRAPSLSSISSADTKSPDEKTRIRRCKIALSSITDSHLKRSSVVNSTLSTLPSVKWSHITDSVLTNILTLKRASIDSATISNVVDVRRATIINSTITDAIRIKKASTQNSSLRRVALLERSTIKNCVVNDCIIYKTDFEGMLLENGIWKGGCLVGRVDQGREVVARALEGGEFSGVEKRVGNNDDESNEQNGMGDVNVSLDKKGNEEALPVYKS
ncbi:Hypothetical protein PENO1_066030 [Penicillium occitanis (nom. inval.)]|nr:Hypothetical protein PENO1_066030 [Penicillium occitanis (nom. inval.)]PCG97322.1 hypothetical protein PENOC_068450 [Penicillium occitanis (nom. inval.)]